MYGFGSGVKGHAPSTKGVFISDLNGISNQGYKKHRGNSLTWQ